MSKEHGEHGTHETTTGRTVQWFKNQTGRLVEVTAFTFAAETGVRLGAQFFKSGWENFVSSGNPLGAILGVVPSVIGAIVGGKELRQSSDRLKTWMYVGVKAIATAAPTFLPQIAPIAFLASAITTVWALQKSQPAAAHGH